MAEERCVVGRDSHLGSLFAGGHRMRQNGSYLVGGLDHSGRAVRDAIPSAGTEVAMGDRVWGVRSTRSRWIRLAGVVLSVGLFAAGCAPVIEPSSASVPARSTKPSPVAAATPPPTPTPVGGVGLGHDKVVAIDAASGEVVETVAVDGDPLLLMIAGGQVWTLDFVPGALSRIDPLTFERTVVRLDGQAVAIFGDGRDLWAAANERYLVQLDGSTGEVKATFELAPERIFRLRDAGFLAVADGEAWMTVPVIGMAAEPQALWRIDAQTGIVSERYPLPRDPLTPHIAYGAVWVPALGDNAVIRIDQTTKDVATVRMGDLPLSVTAGADSIWVALERSRTVARLSPTDGQLLAEILVDTPPRGVTFGGGSVWAATEGGLTEIDPATNTVRRQVRLVEPKHDFGGSGVAYLDGIVWVSIE